MQFSCTCIIYKEIFNWTKNPSDYKKHWLCVMLCSYVSSNVYFRMKWKLMGSTGMGEEKVRVHMNVVPRSTRNTNSGTET